MRIVNFIGYRDKTELMLYVAKLLHAVSNARILFIDSFDTQKCRCIVPALVNDDEYVTNYEDIDVAVGFKNHKDIVQYLTQFDQDMNDYDYVFIDTNTDGMIENYPTENANYTFCVSSYDKFDILKTISLMSEIEERKPNFLGKTLVHRVYVYSVLNTSDEKYIDHSFGDMGIKWGALKVHVPLDEGDMSTIIQNQYAEKMRFKDLSSVYKTALIDMVDIIMDKHNKNEIIRVFKSIERRV